MNKNLLVEYLSCRRLPIAQCKDGMQLHQAICDVAPDLYLRLLADRATDVSHKREILLNFLAHEFSRQSMLTQLYALSPTEGLQVVEVIRDQRINRSRTRELILAFLLGHEQFPALAATKKQRVIRLLKHALGERTWSSVRRFLAETSADGNVFLQRELLHWAWNGKSERARETLCFLAGVQVSQHEPILLKRLAARQNLEQGEGLPKETLLGLRGIYHKKVPVKKVYALSRDMHTSVHTDGPLTVFYKEAFREQAKSAPSVVAAPPTVSVRREGPIAALYEAFTHLFQPRDAESASSPGSEGTPGDVQEHKVFIAKQDLSHCVAKACESIPVIEGQVAVILDLSASMVSSGERLYHPVALALALTRLLQERIRHVSLYQVGGLSVFDEEGIPRPQGETDIASALLAAARQEPQAILVISDGYENMRQGDAQYLVQGLRLLGMTMPIYQVVPLFRSVEDLAQRQFGDSVPVIPLAHEDGVRELLAYMLLASADENLSVEEIGKLQQILC